MGCCICKLPEHISCNCEHQHIYYEDFNKITRKSAYKYKSVENFLDMCRKNSVDLSKMFNIRWGDEN